MNKLHTFHIPVMGIGFTIDTPLKVSKYGIDSVISIMDDILLEKLRKMHTLNFGLPYEEISKEHEDYRALRITAYLNLMHDLCEKKFEELINENPDHPDYQQALDMLPESATMDQLEMGSIDVNVMTKIDKDNYRNNEKLPPAFNDAHAAIRGFANSKLHSSLILSAGLNPRLYSYLENFKDFYPDNHGQIRKKIILKVSDYRSALIQGKFLAKKGLWVSEYRMESGLNCGGHAFATDGYLMGPILEEFKQNRSVLQETVYEILVDALTAKEKPIPQHMLPIRLTAQGGVGTSAEHSFLLNHYGLDSIGWGSPFLLVPEATVVDQKTLEKLTQAEEKDLYLSRISPLGVRFHNLRQNTKDTEKNQHIAKGRPGSSCPKKFLTLNKEFKDKGLCVASREYQDLKIKALNQEELSSEAYLNRFQEITEKSCICVGLGTSALIHYSLEHKREGNGVSICPGPNLAYFSRTMSLWEMVDHIYGKTNVIVRTDRPNHFIKELHLYLDYLEEQLSNTTKTEKYMVSFAENLDAGIQYYQTLTTDLDEHMKDQIPFSSQLQEARNRFEGLLERMNSLFSDQIAC